jgi:D-galactarolactone cycloisomerase
MRVDGVRAHVLHHELEEPFQSSFSQFDARTHCLVEIVCDDGTTGWGECLGPARANAAVVQDMSRLVVGRDPLEIEGIWLTLYSQYRDQGQKGLTVTALSGIDVALWDIAGKHFGIPVHVLMGGAFRRQVPAYATGGFRRLSGDRPSTIADEVAGYAEQGFSAAKIKIGYGATEDLKTIAAAREALGPDKRLMIDANHGYDVVEAIAVGRAAAAHGIDWFEEPVVPEDLAGYRDVRRGQPIPVAGGETWYTRWTMRDAIATRSVDILQPDVCGVGGLSEARKVADMASAFGIRLVPHVWGTAVAIAAALQFLAILPPSPPRHEPLEPWLEFDQTPNPFRQAIVKTPILHDRGIVRVPDGPGLGIEIDRDALKRFSIGAE